MAGKLFSFFALLAFCSVLFQIGGAMPVAGQTTDPAPVYKLPVSARSIFGKIVHEILSKRSVDSPEQLHTREAAEESQVYAREAEAEEEA
jgi:hypothetical protein